MKSLLKYFRNGLLVLVPAGLTVYIVYRIFTAVDNLVRTPLQEHLGRQFTSGVGVFLTLVFILLVGMLASLFITRPLLQLLEKLFQRLPLIKLLYCSIKDLINAFVGDKKTFDKPVLVDISGTGKLRALGFVTRESLEFLGLKDDVAVYFPQSYNFAGNIMIIRRECITPINADSSEVMAFIVSGGVSGNDKMGKQ